MGIKNWSQSDLPPTKGRFVGMERIGWRISCFSSECTGRNNPMNFEILCGGGEEYSIISGDVR